ncbi:MAG: efflux RND transporter periplasmic adaptor subunit [Ignavibacteriae bacterium]|nr:efflux RND transporter periplasmic adaptor subunit [Ignavibacteriota bacterium]
MNKNQISILVGIVLLVLVVVGVYFIFFSTKEPSSEGTSTAQGKRILYYRDPMDPTMRSDKPGKSPMGMDMVPVYEGEEGGGIKIDPTTVQNIGVRYETAQRRNLSKTIRTVGKVDYDERKLFYVNTKISGWIDKLYADYTGKFVRKGDRLLEIYSPELVSAEEEYIIALKYKNADSTQTGEQELYRRAHRKLMYWDISHEQIQRLEATRQPEKTMALVAPATGVIVEKNVLQGGNIMAGTNLYKIADLSTVWVNAEVYEYEVPFIKVGQRAAVTLAYIPGKVIAGRVSYIYPYLNPDTRTVRVRVEIPNPNFALKPEMFATVELQSPVTITAVAVPEQAVIHSGERNVVVLSRGDGRFESRDVKLGVLADGYYQVVDGVQEGEKIVVSSQFLLDSESNLKSALQTMSPNGELPMDSASLPAGRQGMKQSSPNEKKLDSMEGMDMPQDKEEKPAEKNESAPLHKNHSK